MVDVRLIAVSATAIANPPPVLPATQRRVAILGDSIAAGLGVAGQCYADLLGVPSGGGRLTVRNFAATGQTVSDSLSRLAEVLAFEPDVVVVAHGAFDAVIVPSPRAMRWVPPQWRGKGRLDPRPYFSRRPLRRLAQRASSAVRWRYKALLLRRFGGSPWISQAQFRTDLRRLSLGLVARPGTRVLVLTPTGIDDRLYPGSAASLDRFAAESSAVVAELAPSAGGRLAICDGLALLDRRTDFFRDGFHPNAAGHAKLAAALAEQVARLLRPPHDAD